MKFRGIGRAGELYPPWVRALKGKSGTYVIRVHGWVASEIAYVGESHTGRLYETLTRHFQRWSGPTSGPTFARQDCDVAVVVTRPERAVARQNALIARHRPQHNTVANPDADPVPF